MRLIYPEPGPEMTPLELIESGGLRSLEAPARPGDPARPFIFSNFAATVNGYAAIDGASGAIGSDTDTAMLMALRSVADAVLVGAGTVRGENYGKLIPGSQMQERRAEMDLPSQPLAVIPTSSMDLPWDAGLFSSGEGSVLIATDSGIEPPDTATPVEVIRFDGEVDLAALLQALSADHGVATLLCEGGPVLHAELVDSGLLDQIFLTIGKLLGGGDGPGITSGLSDEPRPLELIWLAEEAGELFSRYRLA